MSNKIVTGEGAHGVTPVSWRKLDRRERPRPANSDPSGAAAAPPVPTDEEVTEEAFKRGYSQGVESTQVDAEAQVRPLIERLALNIKTLADLRHRMRHNAEDDLVKLSIAVARRILHRELSVDPDSIQGIVRVALDKLKSKEVSRIRIHPSQESPIRNHLATLGPSIHIQLVADTTLQPGDLVFETTQGDFDASLDFQLREIERGFADRLNG